MLAKATPENAIAFVKLSVFISLLWPLSATATRWQVVRFKTLIWLSYANLWCLFVPIVVSYQDCISNPNICVKSIPILAGNIQCITDITICQLYHKQLQPLIAEMESHCKRAKGHERKILQQYVDNYGTFYIAAVILYYLTTVYVVSTPSSDNLPVNAKYPFNLTSPLTLGIIYAQQSFVGLQISSALCTSIFVALLLWFASAKFDMLCTEIRTTTNVNDLIRCIQKHQKSSNVGTAVYESQWYSQNVYVQKILLPIILRCQKPVTITIACVIPILSLQYFSSFISTGFSYFTAIRVMIEKDNVQ
ncbi:uncharacterized protein LOC109854236 [Pseudomyrmex gracilis]|uniref:uncharacterized protein LOC109854236 n=1 Tax=Pseudomyrmex gracilis TaxID=219809 RepID=UPI0009954962|nr:uncharacterized protein LOC109854236 [Pseudomyrmex gracilis]